MSTFNSVNPTTLGGPRQQETPAITQRPPTNALPEGLTKFVEICHEKASELKFDSKKIAEMQLQLKNLIEKANKMGKLWENDWLKQELPIYNRSVSFELYCNLPKSSSSSSGNNSSKNFESKNTFKKNGKNMKNVKRDANSTNSSLDDLDELSSESRKKARASRFERELSITPKASTSVNEEVIIQASKAPPRGTCQNLEKSYLRLTSAPDPSKIRPFPVLQKAFAFLMDKYKNGAKYSYLCDQFKSIRQDLRVQLYENEFTVKVYETHGRIAIENKDLGEFNQCQTVLKNLYQMRHINTSANEVDFLSYRILYFLFTRNYDSISLIKLNLTSKEKSHPLIIQALKISKAHIANNYYELFKLYSKTTGTTRNLLNCFIDNERVRSLAVICTAYKVLSLEFLLKNFHFENEADCMKFIKDKQLEKFIELRGDNVVYLNTANAKSTVASFLNQSRKVDIKGQI